MTEDRTSNDVVQLLKRFENLIALAPVRDTPFAGATPIMHADRIIRLTVKTVILPRSTPINLESSRPRW